MATALGPIIGSLVRPLGGWLSDKIGGARVTFSTFVVMIAAILSVLFFLAAHSFTGFFLSFMLLF
jgi:NNP family nitrate/nitrite transporter-like MFS transporter